MGNICKAPTNQSYQSTYGNPDLPHPLYATQCKQKPKLPFDEQTLASVHHQPLITPGWYSSKHSIVLDSYYLILHFDLYYRGQWRRGMPHGLGEVITKDGQYFKGYFSEGVALGPQCLYVLSAHSYYLGTVDRNQRSGKGKFVDGQYYYEGYWFNNVPHGVGKQTYPNGDTFEGGFTQGIKNGQGIYIWREGPFDSFQGNFKGDQLWGKGKLKMRDGVLWDGVFDCEEQFGVSKCQCVAQDHKFKGQIVEGYPHQTFTVTDGKNTYKLMMEQGKITGMNQQVQSQVIFRNKVLRYYEPKTNPKLIQSVIEEIEASYRGVKKHSEALDRLKKALPDLRCTFWREGDKISGFVIIPICGKYIQVVDPSSELKL